MLVARDLETRAAYAHDASGIAAVPDAVARPGCVDDVVELLRQASRDGVPVTPAGMQTSTTGASVAERGVLLSLRGMGRVLDVDPASRIVRVEAGALVGDVQRAAADVGLLFPPDPTSENECSIGGAIACNASGARTLKYGATRAYVRALTVVLASGETVTFRRREIDKNTAGYVFAHDPIDWFVGSEGTLGVIVTAELALLPRPEQVVGLEIPFGSEDDALRFVVAARTSPSVSPRCLEYLDERAAAIAHGAADATTPVVYVEQELPGDGAATERALDAWLTLAESCAAAADAIRVLDGPQALATARRERHAVPATMNERGAAMRARGGRKVSTDWAVPFRRLGEALARARAHAAEAGVAPAVTYGHAGNGHPHQNYVAREADELALVERVVEAMLRDVVRLGGTVAAEHGIGKLKRRWLPLQAGPLEIAAMRALKRTLDPAGILAPGNIFAEPGA